MYELADIFDVHENTIWNVLKNYNFEFKETEEDEDIYLKMEKFNEVLDDEYFYK